MMAVIELPSSALHLGAASSATYYLLSDKRFNYMKSEGVLTQKRQEI